MIDTAWMADAVVQVLAMEAKLSEETEQERALQKQAAQQEVTLLPLLMHPP